MPDLQLHESHCDGETGHSLARMIQARPRGRLRGRGTKAHGNPLLVKHISQTRIPDTDTFFLPRASPLARPTVLSKVEGRDTPDEERSHGSAMAVMKAGSLGRVPWLFPLFRSIGIYYCVAPLGLIPCSPVCPVPVHDDAVIQGPDSNRGPVKTVLAGGHLNDKAG